MVRRISAILNQVTSEAVKKSESDKTQTEQQTKLKVLQRWFNEGQESLEKNLTSNIENSSENKEDLANLFKNLRIEIHLRRS